MAVGLMQGQFHWVRDDVIVFPEDRDREPHVSRGCVIIEGDESLADGSPTIEVIPTSSQIERKGRYDVVIPSPPVPQPGCVALVRLLQPILRSDLKSLVTQLDPEWVQQLLAAHLLAIGVRAQDSPVAENIASAE
jgi:mRNA-degrading endonuclease toxin of MazEF toxin-antitoxin module